MSNSKRKYQQFVSFHSREYIDLKNSSVSDDILKYIRHLIPLKGWDVFRSGVWQYFKPEGVYVPLQGWKIHISTSYDNCIDVAKKTVKLLVENNIYFKMLADMNAYHFMNSKVQNRGSSGKFFTIYPQNIDEFKFVIEELNKLIGTYDGPYILSDRRYKDSKCIFYRYGGIRPNKRKSYEGFDEYILIKPNNDKVVDGRNAYCDFPEWVEDPFKNEQWFIEQYSSKQVGDLLLNNRYKVESVIQFSSTGGVYKAYDTMEDKIVVVKEARPYTSSRKNEDAVSRLIDEKNFLIMFNDSIRIPKYIDFFMEWEHYYLVIEYIEGINFTSYMNKNNLMRNLDSPLTLKDYKHQLVNIWLQIANYISNVHSQNWILGDLSLSNIMIIEDLNQPKVVLIDFEGAFCINNKNKNLVTYGYSPSNILINPKKRDIYAFASIMIASIFPLNGLYGILSDVEKKEIIDYLLCLFEVNFELSDFLDDILSEKFNKYKNIEDVISFLKNFNINDNSIDKRIDISSIEMNQFISRLLNGIKENIDYHRQDRIAPCDPDIYVTNCFNIQHGAAGIAHTFYYIDGSIDSRLGGWLLDKNYKDHAPGLYNGLSGLAWVLLEVGYEEVAFKILTEIVQSPESFKDATLYNGAAGIGMTMLYTFYKTSDEKWLDYAKNIGDTIIKMGNSHQEATSWKTVRNLTYINFAFGSAGISYFLIELFLATNDLTYLKYAQSGVKYIVQNLIDVGIHLAVPTDAIENNKNKVVSPYLTNGTTGVLHTLLRYWKITKDEDVLHIINRLLKDLDRSITPFPSLGQGMAGIVNILIDVVLILEDEEYISKIEQYLLSISKYEVQHTKSNNSSMPGEQLLRISNDFITGSAGVLCTIKRYIDLIEGKDAFNFNFTLDEFHKYYYTSLNREGKNENKVQ